MDRMINQINEYYYKFLDLAPKLLIGLVVAAIFLFVLRFVRRKLGKFIALKAEDKLLVNFMDGVFQIINVTLAILVFLFSIGKSNFASGILGAATISSVVIGFAFKDIAENFLAGVILAFNRPFRIGDTVMTGNIEGSITEMSLRDTRIKTFDGKDVYIPNGQIIKNPLFNYTIDGFLRKSFNVGLDYGTDVESARAIIIDTLKTIPGVLTEQKGPRTLVNELGANSINVVVQYWINTFDTSFLGIEIHSQAIINVLNNLEKAGVNMPGNILELKNYRDQPLKS